MIIPRGIGRFHRGTEPAKKAATQRTKEIEGTRRYLLEVQIQLPATKQEEFAKSGRAFLKNFKDEHLTLVASAWRTDIGPIFAVNYWDMGSDANVLFEAELSLPDVSGFNAFNAVVENEIKNIVVPIAAEEVHLDGLPKEGKLPGSLFRYLRVATITSTANLGEFVARVEAHLRRFTSKNKWLLGDTYLSITGSEGSISQLWIIPAEDGPKVADFLGKAPWLRRDVCKDPPTFQIMRATLSDPLIEDA